MKGGVYLDEWLGRRGEPLEPAKIQYVTKPGTSCRKCIFDGQLAEVCNEAARKAGRLGMKDCEDGVVYVLKEIDPRQLVIAVPE